MGDLQSEEERDVVIKLSIESLPIPREQTPQSLLNVTANYFNVISSNLDTTFGNLGALRTGRWHFIHFVKIKIIDQGSS